jgi:multidrug resistance efflux pump
MDSLPPIPTPLSQRWREFRIRVLPLLFFGGIAFTGTVLWKQVAVPPMMAVGYAETNVANVAAPLPGFVAQMTVRRFQQVKAGEQICQLVIKDPKILAAELAVVEAQIQLIRIGMAPVLDIAGADLKYYQLRLELMKERAAQAADRVNLHQAQEDFKRAEPLFQDKIITPAQFDLKKTAVDLLETSIKERAKALERLDEDLKNFVLPEGLQGGSLNPIQASIAVQEMKLKEIEAADSPRFLYSPIDGTVSFVHRRSGESVLAGEAVITISSVQSDQIVGYVRQPLVYSPKIGMAVHVRARTAHRETGEATITQIGPQMEAYSSAMLPFVSTRPIEWGLPVLVSLPAGLKLTPGELVDIIFESKESR